MRYSNDIRPWNGVDWSKLLIYVGYGPADTNLPTEFQFLKYDVAARALTQLRSISVHSSLGNLGKIVQLPQVGGLMFLNNPSSGTMYYWDGDLLGDGGVRYATMTNILQFGYPASYYVFVPNPIYGSVLPDGDEFYAAMVCYNPKPGPYSFLLWRIRSGGSGI